MVFSFITVSSVVCFVLESLLHDTVNAAIAINDKNLIVTIKKSQLAKDSENQRPEVFTAGNRLDAKITELDPVARKIGLSVKAAQIEEEKSLVAKFGAGAAKSGATLKGIFEKALSGKGKKKKEEE
mgnify:CR=1 FL=1